MGFYRCALKLIPKMSWQIWWEVPLQLMEIEAEFEIYKFLLLYIIPNIMEWSNE